MTSRMRDSFWLHGRSGYWQPLCGNSLGEHLFAVIDTVQQGTTDPTKGNVMKTLNWRFQGVMFNYCTITIWFPPLKIQSNTGKLWLQQFGTKTRPKPLLYKLFIPFNFHFHQSNTKSINHFYTLFPKAAASCTDNTSWETEISKLPVCHGCIQAAGPIISALLQL